MLLLFNDKDDGSAGQRQSCYASLYSLALSVLILVTRSGELDFGTLIVSAADRYAAGNLPFSIQACRLLPELALPDLHCACVE